MLVPADLANARERRPRDRAGRGGGGRGAVETDRRSIETVVTLETENYLKGALGTTLQFRRPRRDAGPLPEHRGRRAAVRRRPAGDGLSRRGAARAVHPGPQPGRVPRRRADVWGGVVPPPAVTPCARDRSCAAIAAGAPLRSRSSNEGRALASEGLRWSRASSRVRSGGLSAAPSRRSCCTLSPPRAGLSEVRYDVNGQEVHAEVEATPVRYYVTELVSETCQRLSVSRAVGRAFETWPAVPTASVVRVRRIHRSLPGEDDGADDAWLSRRAATSIACSHPRAISVDELTGELLEADIFFNAAFPWSVAPAGERGRWDLESIALHEIGHLSGLGHSAIGETELASGGGRRCCRPGP